MKKHFSNRKAILLLQCFVILAASGSIFIQQQSLNRSAEYIKQTNFSFEEYKIKFLQAEESGNKELQKKLVNGFVQISINANVHMSDGQRHFNQASQTLCFWIIAGSLLSIVSSVKGSPISVSGQ